MVVVVPTGPEVEAAQGLGLLAMGCGWLIWKLLIVELLKLKEVSDGQD